MRYTGPPRGGPSSGDRSESFSFIVVISPISNRMLILKKRGPFAFIISDPLIHFYGDKEKKKFAIMDSVLVILIFLKVMIIIRLVTCDELIQVPVFLLPLEEPAVEPHQNVESVTKQGATIVITL